MAKERGLTYVKLDGNIGILGNGAGLVMSTLDVVAQAGGEPANFLDAGGGSKAEAIVSAVEVILSNPKVTAVLFNIFGGITRCDEVARGLIEAFAQIKPEVPFVVRLDGTNDEEGRRLLAEANLPNVHVEKTMLGAAAKVVELARPMSILVDTDTRLVVTGLTGREGTFHATNNKNYGTDVVAGVTPGKGGQDVEGIPVFDTVHEAVGRAGRQHRDDLRPGALRRRLGPRGRRRRHRGRHLHHRGHPRARHAARLHAPQAHAHAAHRPQLPGRALARQGQRRDHPRRRSSPRATSASCRARAR